jgi:hypothetical protein
MLAQSGNISSYVYPVRVQIVQASHNALGKGEGRGNVFDPILGTKGFDYVYVGCRAIDPTQAQDRYPARWQSAQQLVVRTVPVGSNRPVECILTTSLRDFTYEVDKGRSCHHQACPRAPHRGLGEQND